jgi:S-formylglutathione hydrolase
VRLVDFRHPSNALSRQKFAAVLLPDREKGARYPACYLLHGFGGNRMSWIERTSLKEVVEHLGIAFVMPESGRRWLINDHQGNRYENYLLQDLMPAVEAEFPVDGRRVIGGFSMGGATAMFHALAYPDRFIAGFSHAGPYYTCHRVGDPYADIRREARLLIPDAEQNDAVWGPVGSATRAHYDPARLLDVFVKSGGRRPLLHIDVGQDDFDRIVMMARVFHHALGVHGIPHEYHELPGAHDWSYVKDAFRSVVPFLERCR